MVHGAWCQSGGKGGIGGVLLSNISVISFSCSGPVTVNNVMEAEVETCSYMWKVIGELDKNTNKVMCVDSKNVVEMYEKAKTGIIDQREGYLVIKKLCESFPNVTIGYINRCWNKEADLLPKQGLNINKIIKAWY